MTEQQRIKTFGEHVSFGRMAKHLSKSELARRVGITPQYISDIERNRTVPSEEFIEIIVGILELDEKESFKLAGKIPQRIIEQARKDYFEER